MDCTTTGMAEPTATPPTQVVTVLRRCEKGIFKRYSPECAVWTTILDRFSAGGYFRRRPKSVRMCRRSIRCTEPEQHGVVGERVLSGVGHAYDRQSKVVQRCEGLRFHHARWWRQGLLRQLQLHLGEWLQNSRRRRVGRVRPGARSEGARRRKCEQGRRTIVRSLRREGDSSNGVPFSFSRR